MKVLKKGFRVNEFQGEIQGAHSNRSREIFTLYNLLSKGNPTSVFQFSGTALLLVNW